MASIGRNLEIMAAVRLINKRLAGVAAAVADEVEGTMLTQAGLIASEMKHVAPVSHTDEHPGLLRDTIRVEPGKTNKKKAFSVSIKAGGIKTRSHVTNGKAGFSYDYDYARAMEFGTQDQPAHPFFWPIWRLRRKGARVAVRKAAVNAVRKVWGDK